MLTIESRVFDGILRDNAAIIFNFNVELIVRQNAFAKLQDFGKPIGTKPMFHVAPDMCLQQHLFFLAGLAAAIDKFSHDMTNFGYVGVSRDIIAIR